MILALFTILIVVGCFATLTNWRYGIFWFVAVGLLQDPVRKLTPGVPGFLVLATTPIWAAMVIQMWKAGLRWRRIAVAFPGLGRATLAFVVSLFPAAVISATLGPGSWQLTLLGGFTYMSLLASASAGYLLFRNMDGLRRFLAFYCVATAVLLSGSLLEYLSIPFPALGTEMLGMIWTRDIPGTVIHMISGFFRSPDVMGWHAAAAAMIAMALALSGRLGSRWFWIALAVWSASIVILCGRRKMVYMLPLFVMVVTWLLWIYGRRWNMLSLVATMLLSVTGLLFLYRSIGTDESFVAYYTSSPGDAYASVEKHGFDAVVETYRQMGFFGGGLGLAAQGAHHLSVDNSGVWQESGPSRALVDLGVPGLLALLVLGLVLLSCLMRIIRGLAAARSVHLPMWSGLLAMVLANASSFVVSGQIFGDPFISCLLAILIGVLLGARRLEGATPAPSRLNQSRSPRAAQHVQRQVIQGIR